MPCQCGAQGDSGGPFVCKDEQDQWTVIGAVSLRADVFLSVLALYRVRIVIVLYACGKTFA